MHKKVSDSETAVNMLRILVDDYGMTQTSISKHMMFSRNAIRNVMIGKSNPSQRFIDKLNAMLVKIESEIALR
jgi:transcriptional regulator with XRE-family HTH domain